MEYKVARKCGKSYTQIQRLANRKPIEMIMRIEPNDEVKFREFVHCAECKHRPIWEMGRIDKFAEAPIIDETTVADFLKKSQKKTRRDYTCPYLWDAEGFYEMPKDDFFCKYGEK